MSDLSNITENTQKNIEQDGRLSVNEAKNDVQDTRLTDTENVANAAQAKNNEQDTRLDIIETDIQAVVATNTEQDTRLTNTEAVADAAALKDIEQDGRLDATESVANTAETKNNEQDGRLTDIETTNTQQDTRLTDTETVANQALATANAAIPAAEKGVLNGVAQLDGSGKIPISQIPSLAKSSKVVADITARDSILTDDRFEGLRVHVLDASADTSVTTGSAGYILKSGLTNSDWEKAYESESLDLDLDANIDNHLNTSSASANQILSWDGTDYSWVDDQIGGGTSYTDASVDTHLNTSSATNGQILSYDTIAGDYVWVDDQTGGAGYTDSDVDIHLNTSTANANQILSWNGTDYAWVNDQTGGGGGGGTAAVYNLLYDDEIFYDTGDETYFPFVDNSANGGLVPAFGTTTEFISSSTPNKAVGQRFTFKSTKTITSVDFAISNINFGNPQGTVILEIKEALGAKTLLASTSFDIGTALSGVGNTTILNVSIPGGVTLSPDIYTVSLRFTNYISGILYFRKSVIGFTDPNPPYIINYEAGGTKLYEGCLVRDNNGLGAFSIAANENLCFRINVDKDPVTGFVPQIQFFEDIILQTPGLASTVNVIPVSESPILMPNNGDIAYVIPNTSAPGGNLTVTVVNGPQNVPTNARIIATKIQESETVTDSGGTSSITTDKKNIIMIENQAIRATTPRLYSFNVSSLIARTGHTKGISMPIKLRLFNNTI